MKSEGVRGLVCDICGKSIGVLYYKKSEIFLFKKNERRTYCPKCYPKARMVLF